MSIHEVIECLHPCFLTSFGDIYMDIYMGIKLTLAVDPMPTSLESGTFANIWKCTLVHLLLKTVGVDPLFVNCRPISNLQYISKLTEKVVFSQTHLHMTTHSLYPELQSSYRRYHSTETALLKVTNDILLKMNPQEVTLLVTLDLSSAFDTVNHEILLRRLHNEFGIHRKVLDWFKSYLHNRGQQISIEGILSQRFNLDSGVPQGSCLGPLLFIIYASKLFKIIEDQLPDSHGYADDTQLYLSFKPSLSTSQADALCLMESCIEKIRRWMIQDKLLMNDGKTKFLVIGTRQQLCELQPISISVNNSVISPSPHIKNLGSWLDSNLNMMTHITKVCKACFFHLYNIRRIKKYPSRDNLLILVHAFITSRLDYCNSLFYGLPGKQIAKLQRVQNAVARLVMDVPKYSHITPVLYELHWLPVQARIQFKVLLFAFKAIHDLAPSYIKDLINVKSKSSFNLRSAGKMLTTLGA